VGANFFLSGLASILENAGPTVGKLFMQFVIEAGYTGFIMAKTTKKIKYDYVELSQILSNIQGLLNDHEDDDDCTMYAQITGLLKNTLEKHALPKSVQKGIEHALSQYEFGDSYDAVCDILDDIELPQCGCTCGKCNHHN
jgi:hypothetical protein